LQSIYIAEIAGYLYYFVTCILCIIVAMVLLYRLLGKPKPSERFLSGSLMLVASSQACLRWQESLR
jgi:hypothetical protein